MIVNLQKFIAEERAYWSRLEALLDRLENDPEYVMDLEGIRHFHYLYQRASSDLAKIMTFASEPAMRQYLESLVGRAYGEIHETRRKPHRIAPFHWFFRTFPRTFRHHAGVFLLSVLIVIAGAAFGGLAISFDPEAKEVILPFSHLLGNPSERVAEEEGRFPDSKSGSQDEDKDRLEGVKTTFSAYLMTHNTRVSILLLALGITWGVGTIILLFYNGVILGAVAVDYLLAGEWEFLLGWLLPHGAIEIPSFILAGQAGLVLAGTLIGRNGNSSLKNRLRAISGDLVTLISGVAILLVWAGLVEAFLSQYHEPVIPYFLKIGFGTTEFILLVWFLGFCGREKNEGSVTLKRNGP